MTIHHLSPPGPPPRPPRSGEPWTDDDYEQLLDLCREGLTLPAAALRLGRSEAAVRGRAMKLLPVDERGTPQDRVLVQLRTHLEDEDEYDWRKHLAATPPPRPVINHVHPPAVLSGIEGLQDDELLAMASALAVLRAPAEEVSYLAEACAHEVTRRKLQGDLRSGMAHDASWRAEDFLARARYPYSSRDCAQDL